MKKILFIVELCFIVAGLFALNCLVENVLNPDYTAGWQSRAEWEAEGQKGGIPPDKEVYRAGIMRDRNTDRLALFATFSVLIAGYYCAKAASKEVRRRGMIIPADETENLDVSTIISNRRIVLMRFVSILLFMMFAILMTTLILGHPMTNIDKTGSIVTTNPYFGNDTVNMLLFSMYMPIAICIAPYFVFRKITNILTPKFCLALFAAVILIIIICYLLHIPQYAVPLIANSISGLGIFVSFARKMDRVAKTLGM